MDEGGGIPPPWGPIPEQLLYEIGGRTNYNSPAPLATFPRVTTFPVSGESFAQNNGFLSFFGTENNNATTLPTFPRVTTFPISDASFLQTGSIFAEKIGFPYLMGRENTTANGNESAYFGNYYTPAVGGGNPLIVGESSGSERRSMPCKWGKKWVSSSEEGIAGESEEEWRQEEERDIDYLLCEEGGGGDDCDEDSGEGEEEEEMSTGHYSGGEEEGGRVDEKEWIEETKEEMGRIITQVLRGKDRLVVLDEAMDFFHGKRREEEVRRMRRGHFVD